MRLLGLALMHQAQFDEAAALLKSVGDLLPAMDSGRRYEARRL
jgi:hypothetical protein